MLTAYVQFGNKKDADKFKASNLDMWCEDIRTDHTTNFLCQVYSDRIDGFMLFLYGGDFSKYPYCRIMGES